MSTHEALSREMLLFHRLYHEKISRRLRALHTEAISQVEYLLLSLVLANGPMTVKDICDKSMMIKQQVARNLGALEEGGFITRERSQKDRRTVVVTPTEKAIELQQRVAQAAQQELTKLFGALGESDAQSYLQSIQTINQILGKI